MNGIQRLGILVSKSRTGVFIGRWMRYLQAAVGIALLLRVAGTYYLVWNPVWLHACFNALLAALLLMLLRVKPRQPRRLPTWRSVVMVLAISVSLGFG